MVGVIARFFRDVAFAIRVLSKKPGFTAVAALSLALGIGANTAIFSLIDGLWTRPLAVPDSGRITRVFSVTGQDYEGLFSFPEYQDLRKQASAFQGLVAIGGRGARMPNGDGTFDLLLVNVVSANFFSALGVKPAVGRLFTPEDEPEMAREAVVVLGNSFWKRRYGGNPNVIGTQMNLSRGKVIPFTIIGVLPESFREINPSSDRDLWFPPASWIRLSGNDDFEQRGFRWFNLLGRLAPEASAESASAQVRDVAARMATDWPATNSGRSARVMTDFHYRLENAGTNAIALLIIVFMVLLLCSVNVANLLLARGAGRSREIAIRSALGAGRARLIAQLMTENLVLGAAALCVGIGLAVGLIKLMPHLLVQPPGFQTSINFFHFDDRVLEFSFLLGALTIVLFGLTPAFRISRSDLVPALKGEAGLESGAGSRLRLRHWLVIAQVSISLVLLVATGVLVESFSNTRTDDIGITRKPTLLLWTSYNPDQKQVYQEAVNRVRALPGVSAVAVALRAPLSLSGAGYARKVTFPADARYSGQPPVEIKFNAVSANYLRVMGTALKQGRDFTEQDETSGQPVAIINQRMAQVYWPGENAIDKTFHIAGEGDTAGAGSDYRVVGVVENSPIAAIGEKTEPYMYLPFWRDQLGEITFVAQTDTSAQALAQSARHALVSLDRRLDPMSITTQGQLIQFAAGQYQITAELVTALGFIGLVLTAVGLYGVVSYSVRARTREIGIRMALGSDRSETVRLILREPIIMGAIGLAFGIPLSLAATRLAAGLLFGVAPWNVLVFSLSITLMLFVLFLASFGPARRATRIDPLAALRYD